MRTIIRGACFSLTGSPPPTTSFSFSQATAADDPARRTPDTWHGACGVGSSQPPPGACGGGWESHGVEDPRATSPRRPQVSQRPEAAPRAGSARRTHESRRAGPGGRLKRQGPVRVPGGSPKPRALHASGVPKSSATDAREDRVSTYLVAKKAHFGRKKSRRPAAGPIHESQGGSPGPRSRHLSPTLPHPHQSRSSRGHLVDSRSVVAKWGRGGRGGKTWERQRAGRGRPPRFARAGRYRSLRVSGRGLG